jgi:hypothetical protein
MRLLRFLATKNGYKATDGTAIGARSDSECSGSDENTFKAHFPRHATLGQGGLSGMVETSIMSHSTRAFGSKEELEESFKVFED